MRRILPAILVGAALAAPSTLLAQCAMCGSAAASSPGVARGLAYSIFFLLGMLALVVSWLVALVLRSQAGAGRGGSSAADRGATTITTRPLPTGHAPAEK